MCATRRWLDALACWHAIVAIGCGRFGFDDGSPDATSADDALEAPIPAAAYAMESLEANTMSDASGNGRHGNCMPGQCPAIGAGRVGNGFVFDGVDDVIAIASAAPLEGAFTVAAWISRDISSNDFDCMAAKAFGGGVENSWALCFVSTDDLLFITVPSASGSLPGSAIAAGSWRHVAARWDGTVKSVFVDGELKATMPASTTFDRSPITLGADVDNGVPELHFSGTLDELQLFDRAITDAEIAALVQR